MKKTINIDEKLLQEARELSGAPSDTAAIRRGLEALIAQAAGHRLIALMGSEPDALEYETPRRREPPAPSRRLGKARRQAAQ